MRTRMRTQGQRGASLVELTCAIFVISLGGFGALQMFSHATGETATFRDHEMATEILSNEIEARRAAGFAALAPGEGQPFISASPALEWLAEAEARVDVIDRSAGNRGLLELRVRLRWLVAHRRYAEREMTTLIARRD